jgi:hypothetical protein
MASTRSANGAPYEGSFIFCGFVPDQVASHCQATRPDVVLNDVNHDVMAASRDAEFVIHARHDQHLEVRDCLGEVQPLSSENASKNAL